ncbi:hypothetical protein ACFRMQ_09500 [Kitasatospora sp. NPDC056783]|uniref:hypothetical protein n=1 Tax=Kitasatospora sp. NPDC056783 TaxID=3345943 RepID=UPI0036D1E082
MKFVNTHPARLSNVLGAAVALVAYFLPSLPDALVLALVAAVLGVGEAAQRAEDSKTADALAQPAPAEVHDDEHPDDDQGDQVPGQGELFPAAE